MKLFTARELHEALAHSERGGQALHVWAPGMAFTAKDAKNAKDGEIPIPGCFRRTTTWAHLFDRDPDRLTATAHRLGVRHVVLHGVGSPRLHVDLCGRPLERAIAECRMQNAAPAAEGEPRCGVRCRAQNETVTKETPSSASSATSVVKE